MVLAVMFMTVCSAKDPKVLITYFSPTGTTKSLAQELGTVTGADLFEIEGAQPYTTDDVNLGRAMTLRERLLSYSQLQAAAI